MAAAFPDAAACQDNIPGDRQIPDHPLVSQTVRDCLEEAMDFEGLRAVLGRIHRGELRLVARDTPEPSFFAHEILNAKPYAFLDDAPLEERRSLAVQVRRSTDPASGGDLGALDTDAIERVRDEERPDPRDADELHDALSVAGFLTVDELKDVEPACLAALTAARRAGTATFGVSPDAPGTAVIAVERLPELRAIHPDVTVQSGLKPPASRLAKSWTRSDAIVEMLRGRVTVTGPVTSAALAAPLGISQGDADGALQLLEADGVVLRGRFTPGETDLEWCDRTLLARIHRYTLNRLRAEIEPVTPADFMRFLFRWQHVETSSRLTGLDGLREIVASLDGYELAAAAWERGVLPARLDRYDPSMLDMICLAGEAGWGRLSTASGQGPASRGLSPVPRGGGQTPPPGGGGQTPLSGVRGQTPAPAALVPATPIALFLREHADAWRQLRTIADDPPLDDASRRVLSALRARGASFFADLARACGLDADALRRAVGALVACGLVTSDGFSGLRALVWASRGRPAQRDRRSNFAGRWTAVAAGGDGVTREDAVELQAWTLLRRYGVVFRRLLTRETNAATWRELARVYRRLEARGEIRSGRFVTGMSGEQFALPDAVERLREVRRIAADGALLTISAADPLNLTGIVTAGERIRTATRNRLVYRDGVPLAALEADYVRELTTIEPGTAAEVSRALKARRVPVLAVL
jgi:ATP-dependent Lhr-like helicase